MRLAVHLHKFVWEVEQLDASELDEWRLYLAENPPPDWWEMVAQLSVIMHNLWAKKPKKMEDFKPKIWRRPERTNR